MKRGTNPEIRRSVVGQMLEYAAHATRYWSVETLRARFEADNEGCDASPADRLAALLGDEGEPDADAFWKRVDTNLRAGNLRLLFVADKIPDELTHVVEFLNQQMPDVEVLAVELKQFRGTSVRTLVPRVIGRTAKRRLPGATRPRMTSERFLPEFPEGAVREAARRLLESAAAAGATFEWGSSGVSIRGGCKLWGQPVTVAWLYPPKERWGWMRTRHFSFGSGIIADENLPAELRELLRTYVDRFRDDDFVHDASSQGVDARYVDPQDAATHIDVLVARVETVLVELAAL